MLLRLSPITDHDFYAYFMKQIVLLFIVLIVVRLDQVRTGNANRKVKVVNAMVQFFFLALLCSMVCLLMDAIRSLLNSALHLIYKDHPQ